MNAQRAELEGLMNRLRMARFPEDIFGVAAGDSALEMKLVFRRLIRQCHPNVHLLVDRPLAEGVTERLLHFKAEADRRVDAGIYGDLRKPTPPAGAGGKDDFEPVHFKMGRRTFTATELLGEGLVSDLYRTDWEYDGDDPVILKVTRAAEDNYLMEREYRALRDIWASIENPDLEEFAAKQRHYVPQPVASFLVPDASRHQRRANLIQIPHGRCFSIAELRAKQFPNGVAPGHGYWIFRRLLLTLWLAHQNQWIHGAVTPDHVLVYPEAHGIVLIGWTAATPMGEAVPVADAKFASFLPPELCRREEATPAADIFMAAATTIYLMGGDAVSGTLPPGTPREITKLLLQCLAPQARYRPQDAFELHEVFGVALGPKSFKPMIVP